MVYCMWMFALIDLTTRRMFKWSMSWLTSCERNNTWSRRVAGYRRVSWRSADADRRRRGCWSIRPSSATLVDDNDPSGVDLSYNKRPSVASAGQRHVRQHAVHVRPMQPSVIYWHWRNGASVWDCHQRHFGQDGSTESAGKPNAASVD